MILANFAQDSDFAKQVSAHVRLLELITHESIVESHKIKVAQLYIRLVWHANTGERLNLLQKFDVLSLIVKEIDWEEIHIDLVRDCLEIMGLVTENASGKVQELLEKVEAKAITIREDLEPQLETIRKNIGIEIRFE